MMLSMFALLIPHKRENCKAPESTPELWEHCRAGLAIPFGSTGQWALVSGHGSCLLDDYDSELFNDLSPSAREFMHSIHPEIQDLAKDEHRLDRLYPDVIVELIDVVKSYEELAMEVATRPNVHSGEILAMEKLAKVTQTHRDCSRYAAFGYTFRFNNPLLRGPEDQMLAFDCGLWGEIVSVASHCPEEASHLLAQYLTIYPETVPTKRFIRYMEGRGVTIPNKSEL